MADVVVATVPWQRIAALMTFKSWIKSAAPSCKGLWHLQLLNAEVGAANAGLCVGSKILRMQVSLQA